jgi:hypothetical protein
MIKFSVVCEKEHGFEGWFRSGDDFDQQVESGYLACPVCGSAEVRKALMAPSVRSSKGREPTAPPAVPEVSSEQPSSGEISLGNADQKQVALSPGEIKRRLLAMRRVVEAHCEDVGEQFAEKARAMHDGEEDARAIYGQATPDEVEALQDDGIEVGQIPWVRDDA